ncbi:hypothetical protein [Noviherbaspirillum aridicola]|uniref:hypothetical protein n=1 Tax=Noviherbaspirillum aridicola TaxID=2849687 RepID=UPI001C7F0AFD|nr:hypothetical protein [Noviherbaspirillum aridicola]
MNDNRAQPIGARLLAKVEKGAYHEAEQYLAGATDENRERLIYGFACHEGAVPAASRWAQAASGSSLAHTVLGASLIISGWKIRGDSYAEHVDADAWRPFLESLGRAEEPLLIAADLDKTSADPLAWLIHAEVGGDGDRKKLEHLFLAATSRSPLHWPAHYKYFAATTEKWGGSHQEMFRFARTASGRAPGGHLIHCLVPAAYCEYRLATGEDARKTIRTRRCAQEVAAALHAWADATPDTLAEKLSSIAGGFSDYGLNHFAVACYLCGADKEARDVVAALRDEIETVPWAWISDGIRERANPGFIHDRVKRELDASVG